MIMSTIVYKRSNRFYTMYDFLKPLARLISKTLKTENFWGLARASTDLVH